MAILIVLEPEIVLGPKLTNLEHMIRVASGLAQVPES